MKPGDLLVASNVGIVSLWAAPDMHALGGALHGSDTALVLARHPLFHGADNKNLHLVLTSRGHVGWIEAMFVSNARAVPCREAQTP